MRIDRRGGQAPLEVIEQRDRIERSVGDVEKDEFELHVFPRNDGRFGREPFRRSTVITRVHSRSGEFAITSRAGITTFGDANIEEAIVDGNRIVERVERNVLIGRNPLRPGLQERKIEIVVLRAAVDPVFIRNEFELVGEGLRVGRRANRQTNICRIIRSCTSRATAAASSRSGQCAGVSCEVRGRRSGRQHIVIVRIREARITDVIDIAHVARGQTRHRCALFGNDASRAIIHQNGRLLILDRCQFRRRGRIAIGQQLIRRDQPPLALRQRRVVGRVLANFDGIGHIDARDAGKLGRRAARRSSRDVRCRGITIVIDTISDDFECPGIDELRIRAPLRDRITTIAIAHRPAIAVGIARIVGRTIAIFIDVVGTNLVSRKHLPHATVPARARSIARLHTTFARPDIFRTR